MKSTITIKMDNAAFEDNGNGNELARILEKAAAWAEASILEAGDSKNLFDINGNKVGTLAITD
jgi:hypothetical protein